MYKILLCSLCLSFFSCREKKDDTQPVEQTAPVGSSDEIQLTPQQMKNAAIEVDTPAMRDIHTVLQVNGMVDVPPQNIVSVTFPLGGYLKTMNLLPGMQVRKGEVLAILEDPQYIQLQQDYLMAKSKLRFLESDYARQRELNTTKVTSDKVFQEAAANYESQQILVHSLCEKLALININAGQLTESNISRTTSIYAPITGYVNKVNVNKGRYVNPTDILFELINPADMHLSLTVFEKDIMKLSRGQRVLCFTNNNPEKYEASVQLISTSISEDRSSEVHCHFEKKYPELRPGMYMNAEVHLQHSPSKSVPDEAIVKWQEKRYIFLQQDGNKFRILPVQTGESTNGYTEIKSPLPVSYIITKNAYSVLMMMKNKADES